MPATGNKIDLSGKVFADGGPAFARPASNGSYYAQQGMSLRDYFAAQVISGIRIGTVADAREVAEFAYLLADAMILARARRDDDR